MSQAGGIRIGQCVLEFGGLAQTRERVTEIAFSVFEFPIKYCGGNFEQVDLFDRNGIQPTFRNSRRNLEEAVARLQIWRQGD